jgi:uncharacterized delta-60 repeat protein
VALAVSASSYAATAGAEGELLRYTTTGAPDTTIDKYGRIYLGSPADVGIRAVTAVAGDKIVVATYLPATGGLVLGRYTANGRVDTTFGYGGVATADLPDTNDIPVDLAVDPSGRVLVLLKSQFPVLGNAFSVVRFSTNGLYEPAFSITEGDPLNPVEPVAIRMLPDGRFIVGAGMGKHFAVFRYTAAGVRDTTFAGSGCQIAQNLGQMAAVAADADGRVIVAGTTTTPPIVGVAVRYLANGTVDSSFGWGGVILVDNPNAFSDVVAAMTVNSLNQPIFAMVSATQGGDPVFQVARRTVNGAPDATFGNGGFVTTTFPSLPHTAPTAVAFTGGKIVVLGVGRDNGAYQMVAARYTGTGALDTSFDADGRIVASFSGYSAWARALSIDGSGRIVIGAELTPTN